MKCINEDCTATAKVIDSRLHAVRPHNQHADQNAEIERLKVLERCRKRAASSSTDTLRAIFNEETRAASSSVSDNVSFVAVQSSMYKTGRKALPALPTHAEGVDTLEC